MASDVAAREDRIRERAYYLWEANGRPPGRDEEFWHRACDVIAGDEAKPKTRRQPTQSRRRSRQSA
jgi:hypothetical protein